MRARTDRTWPYGTNHGELGSLSYPSEPPAQVALPLPNDPNDPNHLKVTLMNHRPNHGGLLPNADLCTMMRERGDPSDRNRH